MRRHGSFWSVVWTLALLACVGSASAVGRAQSHVARRVALQRPAELGQIEPDRVTRMNGRAVVRVWQNYSLAAGESVESVSAIDGETRIDGEVWGDVVSVLGPVALGSTANVHGALVVVAGSATVVEGARVHGDLVVVGGTVDAPPTFFPSGQHVIVGATSLGNRLRQVVPWVASGLLWGRLIVPSLPWMWGVIAMFAIVSLAISLLLHGPVTRCAEVLGERPFSTFLAGLLTLLLTGPISLLLAATVVGLAVVPFFLCAVVVAWIAGKVGVARAIGRSITGQGSPESRFEGLRSVAIGFVALCLVYMVPVVGLITWALVGVFGLGAATLTVIGALRRERPKTVKPAPAPAEPAPPGARPSFDTFGGPAPLPGPSAAPSAFVSASDPADASATSSAAGEAPPFASTPFRVAPSSAAAAVADLRAFPRATFVDRLAAGALDIALILIANGVLAPRFLHSRDEFLFLLALGYFVSFWAWKQTTIGGIICNLRLTRVSGGPVGAPEAVVRGLASLFSFFALGLGFLWILRDPEHQAWHDKIAGTLVVKVPADWPLA